MAGFVAHANATLLFEEIDDELRSPLRLQRAQKCSLGCAVGFDTSANGNCLPAAVAGRGSNKLLDARRRAIITGTNAEASPIVRSVITPITTTSSKAIKASRELSIVGSVPVTRQPQDQKSAVFVGLPVTTRLRVLPLPTPPLARSKGRDQKIIAHKRLRQGRGTQVARWSHRRRGRPARPAKPRKRVYLRFRHGPLHSRRAAVIFWRRIERESS